MTGPHTALVLLLATPVCLHLAFADNTPEWENPAAYFPATGGAEWVYHVTTTEPIRNSRAFVERDVVTAVAHGYGTRLVTTRQFEGDSNPYPVSEWSASPAGLLRRNSTDWDDRPRRDAPWHTILPGPVRPGTTWTEDYREGDSRSAHTVVGWEGVRVPAGQFAAVRVDIVITDTKGVDGEITATAWYARGVGLVKMAVEYKEVGWRSVRELVSFWPGVGDRPEPPPAPRRPAKRGGGPVAVRVNSSAS